MPALAEGKFPGDAGLAWTRPGPLTARWDARKRDIVYRTPRSHDGMALWGALAMKRARVDIGKPFGVVYDPSFLEELDARGYDLTTLRFSVQKKA
jgi:hypothetical protein